MYVTCCTISNHYYCTPKVTKIQIYQKRLLYAIILIQVFISAYNCIILNLVMWLLFISSIWLLELFPESYQLRALTLVFFQFALISMTWKRIWLLFAFWEVLPIFRSLSCWWVFSQCINLVYLIFIQLQVIVYFSCVYWYRGLTFVFFSAF